MRPQNIFAYEGASIFDLAASYAEAIAHNHPFIDGNKRTAFTVAGLFLEINGYELMPEQHTEIMVAIAEKKVSRNDIAAYLQKYSASIEADPPPKILINRNSDFKPSTNLHKYLKIGAYDSIMATEPEKQKHQKQQDLFKALGYDRVILYNVGGTTFYAPADNALNTIAKQNSTDPAAIIGTVLQNVVDNGKGTKQKVTSRLQKLIFDSLTNEKGNISERWKAFQSYMLEDENTSEPVKEAITQANSVLLNQDLDSSKKINFIKELYPKINTNGSVPDNLNEEVKKMVENTNGAANTGTQTQGATTGAANSRETANKTLLAISQQLSGLDSANSDKRAGITNTYLLKITDPIENAYQKTLLKAFPKHDDLTRAISKPTISDLSRVRDFLTLDLAAGVDSYPYMMHAIKSMSADLNITEKAKFIADMGRDRFYKNYADASAIAPNLPSGLIEYYKTHPDASTTPDAAMIYAILQPDQKEYIINGEGEETLSNTAKATVYSRNDHDLDLIKTKDFLLDQNTSPAMFKAFLRVNKETEVGTGETSTNLLQQTLRAYQGNQDRLNIVNAFNKKLSASGKDVPYDIYKDLVLSYYNTATKNYDQKLFNLFKETNYKPELLNAFVTISPENYTALEKIFNEELSALGKDDASGGKQIDFVNKIKAAGGTVETIIGNTAKNITVPGAPGSEKNLSNLANNKQAEDKKNERLGKLADRLLNDTKAEPDPAASNFDCIKMLMNIFLGKDLTASEPSKDNTPYLLAKQGIKDANGDGDLKDDVIQYLKNNPDIADKIEGLKSDKSAFDVLKNANLAKNQKELEKDIESIDAKVSTGTLGAVELDTKGNKIAFVLTDANGDSLNSKDSQNTAKYKASQLVIKSTYDFMSDLESTPSLSDAGTWTKMTKSIDNFVKAISSQNVESITIGQMLLHVVTNKDGKTFLSQDGKEPINDETLKTAINAMHNSKAALTGASSSKKEATVYMPGIIFNFKDKSLMNMANAIEISQLRNIAKTAEAGSLPKTLLFNLIEADLPAAHTTTQASPTKPQKDPSRGP